MGDVIQRLTEGDIYRWSYRDVGDDRPYGRYHCCSRIAVVKDGILRDTYWQTGQSFSDGRWFGPDEVGALNLEFVANFADLVPAKEYDSDYFDDADIVDLNHPNSTRGNFYLRKGAKRSPAKMLAVARQRLAEAESDEMTAARRADEMIDIIARLEDGEDVPYIPSWR